MLHKDAQILTWAKHQTTHTATLMDMEKSMKASHSTIWWCFQHRLPKLDVALYDEVLERLDYNKRNKPIHKKGEK